MNTESMGTGIPGAKVPIYELAKDPGSSTRIWSLEIRALGIEAKTTIASRLEPEDVLRIAGQKRSTKERQENTVQERLSDTVIRRRAKDGSMLRPRLPCRHPRRPRRRRPNAVLPARRAGRSHLRAPPQRSGDQARAGSEVRPTVRVRAAAEGQNRLRLPRSWSAAKLRSRQDRRSTRSRSLSRSPQGAADAASPVAAADKPVEVGRRPSGGKARCAGRQSSGSAVSPMLPETPSGCPPKPPGPGRRARGL